MSHLTDHAAAYRCLAAALNNRAEQMGDPTGLLTNLADAHHDAADQIDDLVTAARTDPTCTFNHATMKGPKCLGCGAPKARA